MYAHPRKLAPTPLQRALGAALLSLALSGPALAQGTPAAQPAAQAFEIRPGPLGHSLATFATRAGVALSFDPALTDGLQSPGLQGTHTTGEALARLLAGSGLEAILRADGSYTLRHRGAGDTALAPVTVTAAAERSGITEGSGSYTTRSTAAATGLDLSPRETPQSVSVVTRQRIDDQGLQDLGNILLNTTGVSAQQLDSERTVFAARGFAMSDLQYDGISTYYKSNYAIGESELDSILYDRIEVVRGATGLLAGSGEPSASANLVRKHADSKTFKGEATLGLGSWNNRRGTLDVSTPLTQDGRIRSRIVAAHEDKDAFFDRYERQRSTFYGVVDADLTPATTLSVGASYQHNDAQGLTYGGVPSWYSDGTPARFSRSFTVAPKWNREESKVRNAFVNLDHQFDNGWKAQLRLMRSKSTVDNQRLFVWGFPDPESNLIADEPSIGRFPGYRKQSSIDARLSGPFTLAGREHEAIVGVAHIDHRYAFDWVGPSTAWNSPLAIHDFGSVAEPKWDYSTRELSERNHTRQTAAYGALRLSLADPLKLIVGGRYTRYDREGAGWASSGEYDYNAEKFVPYAGLVVDLNATYSVYGSYTSIFNYQDYRDRSGAWLDPVTGKAYETGIKGAFLGGRLNASLALFRIEQDNLAQEDAGHLIPGTDSTAYYGAQGAVSKGFEAELSGELKPGWQVALGISHFSAKDASDKDVNTSHPRTLLRLFTTYRLPGEWHRLTLGGGVNWQSRVYYDKVGPNGERQQQDAYALASLMASYDFSPALSLQMNVNNVFDKQYQRAVNWYGQTIWGTPREFLATLRYKF
ncbi:TonB-dependent siderophore receptor [Thauera linaloolentis]|uniref:Ferripyoverdine receptor 2 n=1 Tax=Thauera linaloolentis (strain DSM 12138 / JCM 21573 / CCUG 41526 / CIP 105981 / IAM 15112 / NBRC 102519 / 47Lol) TaxID=1123367 RepID=N6Z7D9_THAL4|nr:TonB-dependent siderophore receptor [Thauera linaloolentis]ENO90472.1 ferripyoverdine receptor 2 [Thauera linaloolentis 47Lol = DSM 12138]MCM8566333.1 TonB-dependent siderophore receptor [Thauera linaloolentis]